MRTNRARWQLPALLLLLAGWAPPGHAGNQFCGSALTAPAFSRGPLNTRGREPAEAQFRAPPGHEFLVQVEERNNDALVEVLDGKRQLVAQADHPERRSGTRRAVVTVPDSSILIVRVTGKEHAGAAGTATVTLFDLAGLRDRPDCLAILKALAEADAQYAVGREISSGHSASQASAREAFLHAARAYSTAEHSLGNPADEALRGQTALALAGVEYFDLQDWAQAAMWAQAASEMLAKEDPYRSARADALLAAARIETGSSAPAGRTAPAQGADEGAPLLRARRLLQHLVDFHLQRGERYDAGLQLTNIAVTYLNEGSYEECVRASIKSSQLFGSINELPRRAQAWQNRALCLWGLGQLPEALRWFERALADIGPEPYPTLYMGV